MVFLLETTYRRRTEACESRALEVDMPAVMNFQTFGGRNLFGHKQFLDMRGRNTRG